MGLGGARDSPEILGFLMGPRQPPSPACHTVSQRGASGGVMGALQSGLGGTHLPEARWPLGLCAGSSSCQGHRHRVRVGGESSRIPSTPKPAPLHC